jgi:hypothetical protein
MYAKGGNEQTFSIQPLFVIIIPSCHPKEKASTMDLGVIAVK